MEKPSIAYTKLNNSLQNKAQSSALKGPHRTAQGNAMGPGH